MQSQQIGFFFWWYGISRYNCAAVITHVYAQGSGTFTARIHLGQRFQDPLCPKCCDENSDGFALQSHLSRM
uniref:Uncharacterized protein n=1 Tax=Anguilla anguilla TaxID=7936 RepID=A0A0E9XDR0_ANGAN